MEKEKYPHQRIYERDNFTCQYCGWNGSEKFEDWWIASLSIDHIVPIVSGGTGDDSNLVVSCHQCNTYKGSYKPNSFKDAKDFVLLKKRKEAESWFNKYVIKIEE